MLAVVAQMCVICNCMYLSLYLNLYKESPRDPQMRALLSREVPRSFCEGLVIALRVVERGRCEPWKPGAHRFANHCAELCLVGFGLPRCRVTRIQSGMGRNTQFRNQGASIVLGASICATQSSQSETKCAELLRLLSCPGPDGVASVWLHAAFLCPRLLVPGHLGFTAVDRATDRRPRGRDMYSL